MTPQIPISLPVESALPELLEVLARRDEAILQAPPGAGKTTLVPLALLDAGWLGTQKIIMLEPRRLAARAAAERMACLLNEPVGQTVGYRMRLDNKVSQQTRIEVITEGILSRMLQDDPALEGVGMIIFDEFHERSLDADLGLALTLQSRELFRENTPLKLLLMSATLEQINLSALLNHAPVISSAGRMYPVEVRYGEPWHAQQVITQRVIDLVQQVIKEETGSVLVFLPGQAEIRKIAEVLTTIFKTETDIILAPLYGDLSLQQQRQAIEPVVSGKRKIVLATDIAETSLTIEGVRIVIDAGLCRQPVFEPRTGMSRLHTRRVSQSSSIQRMGRAGRLEAGVCYRLWSQTQQAQLIPHAPAEILQADLVPLALQLLAWGISDTNALGELKWLDTPPQASFAQSLQLLQSLGAAESINKNGKETWRLTGHGEAMAGLPCHPRLAHMLLMGKYHQQDKLACDIAALLSERDPLSTKFQADADIHQRLNLINGQYKSANVNRSLSDRISQQSQYFYKLLKVKQPHNKTGLEKQQVTAPANTDWIGFLLACAYPDRIGLKTKNNSIEYRLSNGRKACLREDDALQRSSWLVVAQSGGKQGFATDQIYLAAELDPALFNDLLSTQVTESISVDWDKQQDRMIAEQQQCIGSLVFKRQEMINLPEEKKSAILLALVRKRGLTLLPWDDELRQWQSRVMLLHQSELQAQPDSQWPDVSDPALFNSLEQWLLPYLNNISHINHFAKLDLKNILQSLLPWPLPKALDERAPVKLQVPSGSLIKIDYSEAPPVLAVRLQEMFGCVDTPTIDNGRLKLKVVLLSPARRPLQVTQDLASFWQTAYPEVKKEMKGRYPKHYWPDDPLIAEATARVRRKPK
ncbi:MAG: ATP-dependent helicase HrpB [Gammaproteobacteria bacterium]|nr:ATP-dependent helicase HrpB [Gammaproteobacteria bacterium]